MVLTWFMAVLSLKNDFKLKIMNTLRKEVGDIILYSKINESLVSINDIVEQVRNNNNRIRVTRATDKSIRELFNNFINSGILNMDIDTGLYYINKNTTLNQLYTDTASDSDTEDESYKDDDSDSDDSDNDSDDNDSIVRKKLKDANTDSNLESELLKSDSKVKECEKLIANLERMQDTSDNVISYVLLLCIISMSINLIFYMSWKFAT